MLQVVLNRKDPFKNKRCSNSSTLDDANLYRQAFQANYSSTVSDHRNKKQSQKKLSGKRLFKAKPLLAYGWWPSGKFKLTNHDSTGGKSFSVLTSI